MPKRKFTITIEVEVDELPEEARQELRSGIGKKCDKMERFIRSHANVISSHVRAEEGIWVDDDKEEDKTQKDHNGKEDKPCDCPVCTLGRLLKGKEATIFSGKGAIKDMLDKITKDMTGKSFDDTTHIEAAQKLVEKYEAFKKDIEEGRDVGSIAHLVIKIGKSIDLIKGIYKHTQSQTPKPGEEEKRGDELLKINEFGQRLEEIFKFFMAKAAKQ